MRSPQLGLEQELVDHINDAEQRQEDVRVDKRASVEGSKGGPALDQRQKHVGKQTEPGVVRVPQRRCGPGPSRQCGSGGASG
jgi:hypothetical protein